MMTGLLSVIPDCQFMNESAKEDQQAEDWVVDFPVELEEFPRRSRRGARSRL
jgi:hypothetical protein